MEKLISEEFIKRAIATHGDIYNYDKTEYINQKTKVVVTCKSHGDFYQLPNNHIKGYGCRKCTKEKKQIAYRNRYIEEATKKHSGKYDYSLIGFPKSNEKITIICPIHGKFKQFSNTHLSGNNCNKCSLEDKSINTRLGKDKFIKKASIIHGDIFEYSKVKYINNNTKVTMTCKKHGDFESLPRSILSGRGCKKCSKTYKYTTKEFIEIARIKHNNFYDYSQSDYINTKTKLKIVCPKHGEFYQDPSSHLRGQKCPSCSKRGFNVQKSGILYYLSLNNGEAYKIGITNKSVKERYSKTDMEKIKILNEVFFKNGKDALEKEKRILKKFRSFKYIGDDILENGNTECFNRDILFLENKEDENGISKIGEIHIKETSWN